MTKERTLAARETVAQTQLLRVALVDAVNDDGGLWLRPTESGQRTALLPARVATAAVYQAQVGDRVLFAAADKNHYVVGVIHSQRQTSLACADGATATLNDGGLDLRDGEGKLLLRYKDGAAVIQAPRGDLHLRAPEGSLKLEAALDVVVSAGRDLRHEAEREVAMGIQGAKPQIRVQPEQTRLETEKLELKAGRFQGVVGRVEHVVDEAYFTAQRLVQSVAHHELSAERMVERARTKFRDVSDLFQSRVGRARQFVDGVYSLKTQRTVMKSEKDTSIDGRKILLG